MATIYYEADADLSVLRERRVAVLGYGSQGHAHALNLRDSGLDVRVGLQAGSRSRARAEEAGLVVRDTDEAAAEADVVVVLTPDTAQRAMWEAGVRDALSPGDALVFSHGFNIHFGLVEPPDDVDVLMVAPKGPGHLVRRLYVEGQGIPGLLAVHRDATGAALDLALGYGAGIGCARAGLLATTFAEETETDLFGEQAVLCGGASHLVQAGFQTLVEAGYQPEVAYFECLHELKLIVDLMYEGGITWMRHSVSDTAEYGDVTRGPRVIGADSRAAMDRILAEVRDGTFAREWIAEHAAGAPDFERLRQEGRASQIEEVGEKLRAMMSWIQPPGEGG
ncbi:MAG: ketol-acid reductoisomerase [Actinobacteria bacterium]|nr:ketol-acid reductoisomerase [Actinomycetota bacterium]